MHQDTICVALQRIPENILADFAGNAVISRRTKKKKREEEEEEEEEKKRNSWSRREHLA